MHLTPAILEAAYTFLAATPPFKRWGLPPGDEIEFHVLATDQLMGHFTQYKATGQPIIGVSTAKVDHTINILIVVGHEMVHLKQAIHKTETSNTTHNAEFRKLARLICKHHGWDAKGF